MTIDKTVRIKALEIIVVALLSVNISVTGWSVNKVFALANDIATINGSCCMSRDAMAIEQRLGKQIADLWHEIAAIRESLATKTNCSDVPTPEVLRRLKAIESKLDTLVAK